MMDIQLKEIVGYLQKQGYDCIPVDNSDGGFIFIDVIINNKEMRLKCELPKSFPYSFPKIYILKEFYKSFVPLPHIDEGGYICTFDSDIAFPNYNKPNELVRETIDKAIKIIKDGLDGTNRDDFIDEFIAYWSIEADDKIKVYVLFSPDNTPSILHYHEDEESNFYVDNDIVHLKEYLKYAKNYDVKTKDIHECIYIPLKKKWYPPYPKTDREIYLKVKEEPKIFEVYYNYLKNRTEMSIVIFSQIISNGILLAGWIHGPVQSPNGFRKGKIYPELLYLCKNKDREVIKLKITQLGRRRLLNRGGDGNMISNCKVSVTGCGSIGSFIIQVLAELGIDNFILIDKQILSSENIARHMCGASEIGKTKTEAIKEKLIKHYPYIKCLSVPKDVFDVFSDNVNIFNNCDINFVVVGDKPTEARFLELFNQNIIVKPVIIIWVEPFLLGGHAIIMQKPQDIQSLLYDNEYNFRNNVLSDGGRYTKKEAGCQSTFIPYSAFEAHQFIYSFIDYFYNNYMLIKKEGNYLFSWCGKLDWARKNEIMISDKWLAKNNRTKNIIRLDKHENI